MVRSPFSIYGRKHTYLLMAFLLAGLRHAIGRMSVVARLKSKRPKPDGCNRLDREAKLPFDQVTPSKRAMLNLPSRSKGLKKKPALNAILCRPPVPVMYGLPLRITRDRSMRQSIDSLSPFAHFQKMRGRFFTAKPDLDERPRSWCFTTCCEMRRAYRSTTLCDVRNYWNTTTMCCVRLGPGTGRRRTWRTGSHLFVRSTIMLALTRTVGRRSGVNGSNLVGSECALSTGTSFILAVSEA